MSITKISILGALASLSVIVGCSGKKFDGPKKEGSILGTENSTSSSTPGSPVIAVTVDNRPIEAVLCQDGPKVVANAKKSDFTGLFALICNGDNTSQLFKDAIVGAYQGQGEPQVKLIKSTSDDNYNTDIVFIQALKAPLANPSMFADLKPHDIFASGIHEINSDLVINVESRASFPGKRAVEQIGLKYSLTNANGAAIFDQRRTEFNTYLLVENNRDIVVSTEHLLDPETNINYHIANGLTIGLKAENGESYMVFLTELVIKNRIDPDRMKVTLLNLNAGVSKMLYKHISANAPR